MVMSDTFQGVFDGIFKEAFELLVERQRKYGPKNVESLGLFGVFNRLSDDKVERIRRAMNGKIEHGRIMLDDIGDFGDESFEDALFDIANYALIMIALKRGVWGKPLAPEVDDSSNSMEAKETYDWLAMGRAPTTRAPSYLLANSSPVLSFEPEEGSGPPARLRDCHDGCCARAGAVPHAGPCNWCPFHSGQGEVPYHL